MHCLHHGRGKGRQDIEVGDVRVRLKRELIKYTTYEGGEERKVLEIIYPGSLLSIVKCMLHLIKV